MRCYLLLCAPRSQILRDGDILLFVCSFVGLFVCLLSVKFVKSFATWQHWWRASIYRIKCDTLFWSKLTAKGLFIATQLNWTELNSTQLNWPSWTAYSQVSRVFVYDFTTYKLSQLLFTLSSWVQWVELCRYKRALKLSVSRHLNSCVKSVIFYRITTQVNVARFLQVLPEYVSIKYFLMATAK